MLSASTQKVQSKNKALAFWIHWSFVSSSIYFLSFWNTPQIQPVFQIEHWHSISAISLTRSSWRRRLVRGKASSIVPQSMRISVLRHRDLIRPSHLQYACALHKTWEQSCKSGCSIYPTLIHPRTDIPVIEWLSSHSYKYIPQIRTISLKEDPLPWHI